MSFCSWSLGFLLLGGAALASAEVSGRAAALNSSRAAVCALAAFKALRSERGDLRLGLALFSVGIEAGTLGCSALSEGVGAVFVTSLRDTKSSPPAKLSSFALVFGRSSSGFFLACFLARAFSFADCAFLDLRSDRCCLRSEADALLSVVSMACFFDAGASADATSSDLFRLLIVAGYGMRSCQMVLLPYIG